MNRNSRIAFVIASLSACLLFAADLQACPSCKAANESNVNLPLAYQTSILFMLFVPAAMVTGLSVLLYRLNKVQVAATEAFETGAVWNPVHSEG